ncbi:MAG TPA: BTAD domain-containing putative transcriptional regulator, partial [Caldilineaceae bacterium]|nr:BTAD domain-containing putative transcriptional regulator [Caldilineaceae bacterium]
MAILTLRLLGRPQMFIGDQQIEMKSQKAQALFYYLAMSRQIHSRQGLAGLLWSDLGEVAARRNLRVELLKLRTVADDYLETSRDTIGLNRKSDYTLDVERFEACLHGHEPSFEELLEAVNLYQGEFLEDFHIRDAPLFEEWVTAERERLSQMARQATLRLVEHCIQQQAYDRGIEWVNTLLKREPWLEEAHQQQMRLLALNGQRSAALAHYEIASRILDEEFGVPPSDETNALYDQIESGAFEQEYRPLAPRAAVASGMQSAVQTPPFQAPAAQLHFVGRQEELQTLHAALTGEKRARVVALVGMAGVGKTTLVAQLARLLRDHFRDGVLWAYTADSEPLDILGSWAQALGYDFSSLSDVENRAAALRGVLVDKEVLLLLDDVRSVARVRPLFVNGEAGVTLLTSRDFDVATALHANIHAITEMTPQDGEQLLTRILGEERVHPEADAARQICTLLQNLPLAVEIAAQRLRSRPRRRLVDMATRLQDTQERLDLAISDRAVRTSFLVSWESLDNEQRRIFALLGLFGGRSFAAPALAYIAELDLYTTEDRLFTLTALSLLNEEESDDETAVRYRQHPLLADFAREQLGDSRAMALRLAHYYLSFAEDERMNYAALQPEWENLMVGLQTAHALAEWQVVIAYAEALTEPWFTRARYTEARHAYALAQEAAEKSGNDQALILCLSRLAQALIEQDDYSSAKKLLERCKSLCEKTGDLAGAAVAYYLLGRGAVEQGEYNEAELALAMSQQLYRDQADTTG